MASTTYSTLSALNKLWEELFWDSNSLSFSGQNLREGAYLGEHIPILL